MKKYLLLLFFTILSAPCFSQISFQKGYYINNNGQKTECEIKNLDWKNNPTEFEYRLSQNTEIYNISIEFVKEFGVYNYSKYTRRVINIDKSYNNLSTNGHIVNNEKNLFLKVLVEGKSNLYQYEDKDILIFFYSNDNLDSIQQLLYKDFNYNSTGNSIIDNNRFRQQLFNEFKCDKIKVNEIEKISYEKDDLVNFFVQYNQCNNSEQITFKEKQNKDLFNLTFRPRLNNSSLSIFNVTKESFRDADFGSKIGFGFGIEAEFILNFGKNKWAIIAEPTYQYYKSEKQLPTLTAGADYKSIELPVGIRHYFFLNNNAKWFVNGTFTIDVPSNSYIKYNSAILMEISTSTNLGFGIGYKQNDKYSLEIRYQTKRNVVNDYALWGSDYRTLSVIFGYSIF